MKKSEERVTARTSAAVVGTVVRYALAGGLSAAAHLGSLAVLVRFGIDPVSASSIGFAASVVVSYTLQKSWVFRSPRSHARAIPRFAVAVLVGFLLNTFIMGAGTYFYPSQYLLVQLVALVLIPLSNYLVNSFWTFGP